METKTWMCLICGWLYDEAEGAPDHGIAPGTPWEQVPMNWTCPECGAEGRLRDGGDLTRPGSLACGRLMMRRTWICWHFRPRQESCCWSNRGAWSAATPARHRPASWR